MNARIILFFLILSLFSGGCSPNAPAQTVAPTATAAESTRPVAADPTATNPPAPTSTQMPSATSTPVPTSTETPLPPAPTDTPQVLAEFRFTGDVRQMPDANAAVLASFSQGIRLRALNQDPSGQWLYVQIAPYAYGWVQGSAVEGSGLTDLPQATPAVTATPEAQASTGLKCFLTVTYTETGKPKVFQFYLQGLNLLDRYTYKLFNPKGLLLSSLEIKARADGTFYRELSADKLSPATYNMEIYFAGQMVTSCSANLVQK